MNYFDIFFPTLLYRCQAGARRVIGIDRARIIDNAERIVRANGKEGVVRFLFPVQDAFLSSLLHSALDLHACIL